ncbi:GNAT family N-acetyltransferase [Sedimentitalea todarodis]|uniref:GNAT family N-acetyltransferase n=1 Tax=Sedimentitalea todarodis TaxID=1631240 RepID=A0ABU3VI92_9RHOB|nr:GNAT family N-acetyltransferase [Sedimentitalea todarodis]MDU9005896.1 GNAT family N-acetyltransferase [Sedimentitalea todarodis]
MNTDTDHTQPNIRRLWQSDQATLVDFFQRMDLQTRRLRFFAPVDDDYLKSYAEGILSKDTVAYGAFPDQTLRGITELRVLQDKWPRAAEIALLVEPEWQEKGLGDALFDRGITAAQNRNIKSLHMLCLKENKRMQYLAKKHDAVLKFETGETEAALTPPWPTPMSLFYEMFADTRGYLQLMCH